MSDPVKGGLERFVRATMRNDDGVDYAAFYGGKVAAQNTDGTLDVKCDDKRLPGLQRVQMRWGPAGIIALVQQNTRLLVGFENADPARPFVAAMEASGLSTLLLGVSDANGANVTEKALLGSTYRQNEKQMHNDLAAKLSSASAQIAAVATVFATITGTGTAPVLGTALGGVATPFGAAVAALMQAAQVLTLYETQAAARGDDLSARVKLK